METNCCELTQKIFKSPDGLTEYECWVLIIEGKEFWFRGQDVAACLGYNKNTTIKFPKKWCRCWSEFGITTTTTSWPPETIFIHADGLHAFVKCTKNNTLAIIFQKWVEDTFYYDKPPKKISTYFYLPDRFECWVLTIEKENGLKDFWFNGHDVATYLEYENPQEAVIKNIRNEWRRPLKDFGIVSNYWKPDTIFIHESGLYVLLNGSNKLEPLRFQEWIKGELLLKDVMNEEELIIKMLEKMNQRNNLILQGNDMILKMLETLLLKSSSSSSKSVVAGHSFNLLKRKRENNDLDNEYVAIRCQKKSMKKALSRNDPNLYEIIFAKENVPNATKVLTRAKEILKREKIPYTAYGNNKIKTSSHFENIIEKLLNENV